MLAQIAFEAQKQSCKNRHAYCTRIGNEYLFSIEGKHDESYLPAINKISFLRMTKVSRT